MRDLIQSPLNYTGGKFRLLSQILPLFPRKIRIFLDLFCGGGNVGVNVQAERTLYNDIDGHIAALLSLFHDAPPKKLLDEINAVIDRFGLSASGKYGYEFYHCSSSEGLARRNREPYLKLREAYNLLSPKSPGSFRASTMLYVLIAYSFNNQIRFNSMGEFNLPVGKRDFNPRMEAKLARFMGGLKAQDCSFSALDFKAYDVSGLSSQDMVYIDPPYLITRAAYNENGGWGDKNERELLEFIDALDRRGVRFALSNVLSAKGKANLILEKWLKSGKYGVHRLKRDYSNSNYHRLDKSGAAEEILVTNYGAGV